MSKNIVILGASSILLFAAGAASGYFYAKRELDDYYSEASEREILEAKAYYKKQYERPIGIGGEMFITSETLVAEAETLEAEGRQYRMLKEAADALNDYQGGEGEEQQPVKQFYPHRDKAAPAAPYTPPGVNVAEDGTWMLPEVVTGEVEEPKVEEIHHNVFNGPRPQDESDPAFDHDDAPRTPDAPYIINHYEFFADEVGYTQFSFTYYEGDNVLADEKDEEVAEFAEKVGTENLRKFGYRSADDNIVYIRNEKYESEYEIARSEGSYSVEVLGFDIDADPQPKAPARGDDG